MLVGGKPSSKGGCAMRLFWLALICATTCAFCQSPTPFCQSPTPPKVDPDKLFQLPDYFTGHARDYDKFIPRRSEWDNLLMPPTPVRTIPQLQPNNLLIPIPL